MASLTFTLTDVVGVVITVTEQSDGTLLFTADVDESTGAIGDLNALFFDMSDDSLVDGLSVTGVDVTADKFVADKVTKIDSFTNMNGETVNEYGKFDGGVQFGTSGMATDDIQSTSFILGHDSVALTLDDILGQDFGVRLTSVGEINGAREDSLKIGGTAPDTPDTPPEPELVNTAVTDTLIVQEDEGFQTNGTTDVLSTGETSVLANDVSFDGTDSFVYTGAVTGVNSDANAVAQIVEGDNGGSLIIYADGTVDFSANGEFEYLNNEEEDVTSFTYTIEGGSTVALDVVVLGEGDDGGGTIFF